MRPFAARRTNEQVGLAPIHKLAPLLRSEAIAVCNQTAGDVTFRIATQRSADASTSTILAKQYIAYGSTVAANDTTFVTIGATLAAGDQIIVYGSSSSISFNAYGSEVTP